jgi:hypothetical protein
MLVLSLAFVLSGTLSADAVAPVKTISFSFLGDDVAATKRASVATAYGDEFASAILKMPVHA